MTTKTIIPKRKGSGLRKLFYPVITIIVLLTMILAPVLPIMAAIGTGSSTNGNSGTGMSVTLNKPAGTVAGDVLVACIVATTPYGSSPSVAPPDSSWHVIRTTNALQTYYYDMVTYYKVAGASEPSNYTFTSSDFNTSGGLTRLTGVDTNHVVDVSADNQGQGNTDLVDALAPSVTTTYANDVVINFFGNYTSLAGTAPDSFIQGTYTPVLNPLYEYNIPYPGGSYDYPAIAAYSWTQSSAGSTGTRNCRLDKRTSSGGGWWVAQTVAFKAAPRAYFPVASSSAAEADTGHWVGVTLAPNAEGPVEVNFTVSGTAKLGTDFTMITPSPLTINTGSGSASIGINVLEDNLYEEDETIIITLESGTEYFLSGGTQYTYTITNDDLPAPTPVIAYASSSTGISPDTGTTFPPPSEAQALAMNKPAGTVAGDFLLAAISWQSGSGSVINPPVGWTSIRTTYYNGLRVATYYRIADSSDASVVRYTFGLPATDTMNGWHATGGITRYTGVDPTHPIDVSDAAYGQVNYGSTFSAPSVYPNYSNDQIIAVFGTEMPALDIGTPSGMTERFESHYHTASGGGSYYYYWPETAVSDMVWAPATATGVKTATISKDGSIGGSATTCIAQTIAIKPVPIINFYPTSSSGNESITTVNLPVQLSSPKDGPVTVNYAVNAAGTTAKSGADYNLASGTLTFAAGETTKNIALSVINDAEYESNETVQVTLSSPSGAILGANTTYTYTITDSDANPADAIAYQNSNGTNGGIGGVSNHLLGIGKPAGTTAGDFLLACIVNRTDYTHVSVTPPAGWTLIGTTLNSATRVTTFYRFAGTSPGTDPDIYSFTIGTSVYEYEDHATGTILRYTGVDPSNPADVWDGAGASSTTAAAPSVHPSYDNGRLVTVFGSYVPVSFSTPSGMALRNSVHYHSGDTWPVDTWPATYVFDQAWDQASPTGTRASTLTPFGSHSAQWTALSLVIHDAQPGIVVNPTGGLITTEAGGTATFTVRLSSQPTANVTIGLSSSDTTEGTVSPASLTFTPSNWITPQTVTVTGVDDVLADGNIAYTIITAAATSADANYSGRNAADVSVTNNDNDASGITVTPGSGLITTEAGGQATFTVKLNSQPTANVTVALTSSDTTEGTVSPASLSFTTANWNTPQTVTVTGVADTLQDGDISYTINAAASGGDYAGKTASVSVTNYDSPQVTNVTSTANGPYKAGATIPITVTLSQPVNVTGTPRLQLETGTTDQYAAYASGSGTATLTFNYTVQEGDTSADLDYVSSNALTLNGGTINRNSTPGVTATLTLPAPGAAGSLGANRNIVIDTAAPVAPSTPDLAAADDTGTSDSDNITRNTTGLTFSGTAEANSTVTLYDGATSKGTITATGGNWSLDISLAEGVHSVTATATDAAGNVSAASGALSVTVDTTGPAVTVNQAGGQTDPTTAAPINFTATFSEAVVGFATGDVTLGGTAGATTATVTGGPTTYTVAVGGMTTSGTATASIGAGVATDAAGNGNAASTSTDNTVTYNSIVLDTYQNSANSSLYITGRGPSDFHQKLAQTFTVEGSGQFNQFKAMLTPDNYSAQDVLVEIYKTSGEVPTGAPIASQTFTLNLAYGPWHWVTFNFDTPVFLEAGEQYALALDETGDGIALLRWCGSGTADYAGGNGYMSYWPSLAPFDFAFQTFRLVEDAGVTTHLHVDGYTDPTMAGAAHSFTVTAKDNTEATVTGYTGTVHFTSSDSAAVLPANYTFTAGDAGVHTFSATLNTMGEHSITATDTANTAITGAQSAITVITLPALSINDVSLAEGNSGTTNMVFTVTLSAASASTVSADYATADGTAAAGSDYTSTTGTLNIAAGQTTGTISVPIIGDTAYEQDETFYVNLSNASGATISDAQGLGTILNDDAEGTAPVVSTDPDNQTITYGANASFTAAATGTPSPTVQWQVSTDGGSNFNNISNGGVYSGATTITLNLTKPSVSYSGYKYRAVFTNGISPDATTGAAALTVTPLGITGSFTAENKVYNGTTTATVSGRSLTGVLPGDTVSLSDGTAAFADKNVGTGKTVTLSGSALTGADAGNYSLSSVANATADITAKPVTPLIVANDKVYDGTTTATLSSQTVSGVIEPDVVTLEVGAAAFADKDVGTWTVTASSLSLSGADAGNYTLAAATATDAAEITAGSLTISGAVAQNKVYDGNNTATVNFSGASLTGVIGSDAVSINSAGYSASFDNENAGSTKPVTIAGVTLSGADAGNYSLTQPSGLTADITALGITGSFTAENKVYDGTTEAAISGRSLNGVLPGDTVSLSGGTAAFADKNVGTGKTVTLSGAVLAGADAGNYSLSSVADATANIAARPVTVTADAKSKVYGAVDPALTCQVTDGSLASGDSITGALTRVSGENVGDYAIQQGTVAVSDGNSGANYDLNYVGANLAITARPITVTAVTDTKNYDGTTSSDETPEITSGSLASGDAANFTQAFETAAVGTGKTIIPSGSVNDGNGGSNYTVTFVNNTAGVINARALTVSGITANNKVYDSTTAAALNTGSAILAGVEAGDSVTLDVSGAVGIFSDENVGAGKAVIVSGLTLNGADAANYTLTQPGGLTADITALGITGSFTADDKEYDGTTGAAVLSRSLTGVLPGDTASLSDGTAAFADKNVGTGKTVTLSGSALTGADAGNYSLSSVANATADITAKPVTPSIVANDKVYDGTTAATLSSQTVSGAIETDAVTLLVGSANFADKAVGTWTVTASSLSLGGTDAGNYTLAAATATDEAEITAGSLTISGAVAQDKVYDGNNTATVDFSGASLLGAVGADDVSIDSNGYSATFDDGNVGVNKPVTVAGVTLSGADAGNYTLTQPSGLTADITALVITGSFTAENKVYDGTANATVSGRSLTGVLPGDDVSLSGGTATFADKNAGTGKTVTLSGAVLAGTDAGNYTLSSVATTMADITVRAIEVTAVTDTKVYDGTTGSDGTPTITSTLGLVIGDMAEWTQTFDTKDAGTDKTLTPVGTVNDGNGGANYSVAFVPVNTGVIEKATLTITAENKTSQYSDARLSFTVTYNGFISGETLATSGVTGEPSYTTDPTLSDPITQKPGSYTITPALGTLAADNYDFTFVNGTYTVLIEDAAIAFDSQNPVAVRVASNGGNNSAFTWKVIISPADDGDPGDLSVIGPSDISLSFSAVGSGGKWSGTASSFTPATGVAIFNVPAGGLGVETYAAEVTLNNDYFKAAPAEDVLVVYDPSLGFATGGGWFTWPEGTDNPELEGAKTNFGFTMKYNKKGASVQGSFLLIAHLEDGSIVRLKSNALYGLAIIEKTYPGIASFSGKCVYRRVDADGTVLAEAGNQEFTVYVKDMNEPGAGNDLVWFTAKLTVAGEDPFSLDSDGNGKVDENEYVSLGGGNIVVPHTSSSGGSGVVINDNDGTTPPEGGGTTPPEGDGTTPPEGDGTTPPEGDGTTPPDEGGTTPPGRDKKK